MVCDPPFEFYDTKKNLPFIRHYIQKKVVHQRAYDGYINANNLCAAHNKSIDEYLNDNEVKKFIQFTADTIKIPKTHLIQKQSLYIKKHKNMWIHPYIAINLGQWLSFSTSFFISKWVLEWFTGNITDIHKMPTHIRRYLINRKKIPHTHFSILDIFISKFLAMLEELDYILPEKLMLDFALGKMFYKWLRKQGYDPDEMATYTHYFDNNIHQPIQAKLYPNELLYKLDIQIEKWIREASIKYFFDKDKKAIPFVKNVILDKIINELPDLKIKK